MKNEEKIHNNLIEIEETVPDNTTLCAITKYHDLNETKEVIKNGVLDLGESKVQDFLKKYNEINEPVRWHFIGHLQTNKVKDLIGKVYLIQSVDSIKVLNKINNESKKRDEITNILIQYNLTGEDQKFGFSEEQTDEWINAVKDLENVKVLGIMGMGPNTEDTEAIHQVFHNLKYLYDKIDESVTDIDNIEMNILSMGMSHDYPIAIEEGSNLVRIGSKIFS